MTLLLVFFGSVALGACAKSKETPAEAPQPVVVPAAVTIDGPREGMIFRYLDPSTAVATSTTDPATIPPAAAAEVVVFDTNAPPPAGFDLVADLSRGLPATATAKRGFVFSAAAVVTHRRQDRKPTSTLGGARNKRPKVTLFSTSWCGYCKKARKMLKQNKIAFDEFDMESDPKASGRLATLARRAGKDPASLSGVPIIFVGDAVIQGWDEGRVRKLLRL